MTRKNVISVASTI